MDSPGFERFDGIAEYYSEKIAQHGETANGVDWNGEESQKLRFKQLSRIMDSPQPFTVNDVGCGYGALLDYLWDDFLVQSYQGVDICEEMIRAAERRHIQKPRAEFLNASTPNRIRDFSIASGIFNVKLDHKKEEWLEYILSTLELLNCKSKLGFAFNCLTSYSDESMKRDYLYYADPLVLFDFCKRKFSAQVALLHDYGLYEFTILVRKQHE